jgi:hypothetical protein
LCVPLDGGGYLSVRAIDEVPVAADPLGTGMVPARRGSAELSERLTQAEQSLQCALEPLTQASKAILAQLSAVRPHAIEVEFGVELTAEAGAVIAKAGGACHFTVKLAWQRPDAPEVEGSADG